VKRDGRPAGGQRFRCRACRRTFTGRTGTPFAGHRWPLEVIITAVGWYFRYRLSAANVRDLLAERRIDVSARTILAWAHKFGPMLAAEGRRQARPVGIRWHCDETYVRVGGRWAYLYRAVDEGGQVVDVLLRAQRALASARAFFDQAIARRGARPKIVITDKHASYRRAVRRRSWRARHIRTGLHRARGETTKPVERSHVPVKDRLRPMRGLHSITTGQQLLEGIELAHAIRRGHVLSSTVRGSAGRDLPPHERAREAADTFIRLARALASAA
jgi:IS6 family transposase